MFVIAREWGRKEVPWTSPLKRESAVMTMTEKLPLDGSNLYESNYSLGYGKTRATMYEPQ